MKQSIIIFSLIILVTKSVCQDYKAIDSIKEKLKNEKKQDTNTVYRYLTLSNHYVWNKPDSAIFYGNKALILSKLLNFKKGEFVTLQLLSYPLALVREDSVAVAFAYKAIKFAEDEKNQENLLSAYSTLGSVFLHLKEYNKALQYTRKAIDPEYVYLDHVHEHLAQCFIGLEETDSAFFYINKVLEYNKEHNTKYGFGIYLLGKVYFIKGSYDSALIYYKEALDIEVHQENFKKNIANYNIAFSDVFRKMNLPDSAIIYAKIALDVANKAGLPNEKLEALSLLISLFESQAKLDSAYIYQKYAVELRESIYNSDKIRQVELISFNETIRTLEESEKQRKSVNKIIIFSLIAIVLFSFVIIRIISRNGKQRLKAYTLLQKQTKEIDHQKEKAELALNELKATQHQLIQSEKMASLGELTAGIAHEIQNPLNFVNNFSDVNTELISEMEKEMDKGNIIDAKAIAKDIKENEEKIKHHGKRADAIVKGMLQHSRRGSAVKEPTDINKLADEYLRLAYHGVRGKHSSFKVNLKTDFDPTIKCLNIIPQDMGRVLLNLYNNAFYSVSEKKKQSAEDYEPVVSVKTTNTGNQIEIIVKDNGNGIPEKVEDKIFQPFFTTKPAGQGTGLGLSLSYDVVKAHGGEIKVDSKEGEYSEFIVSLPV